MNSCYYIVDRLYKMMFCFIYSHRTTSPFLDPELNHHYSENGNHVEEVQVMLSNGNSPDLEDGLGTLECVKWMITMRIT